MGNMGKPDGTVMAIKNQRAMLASIFSEEVARLEGKCLTLIEATGLQGTQQEALKSLIRQELWIMRDKVWRNLRSYKILEEPPLINLSDVCAEEFPLRLKE